MTPRVFLSHASEDKDHFVLNFAERLRAEAIDAWVDLWEISPGDSLVDKIFKQGMEKADVVIAVVSQHSINKPWVAKEVETAVVQQIIDGKRLIPVVIDDCEIPTALRNLLYVKIKDTSAYDDQYTQVVNAIYGRTAKPPLGLRPMYVSSPIASVAGRGQLDSLVIAEACKAAIDSSSMRIDTTSIYQEAKKAGISVQELEDSLHILGEEGYFENRKHIGGTDLRQIRVTESCLEIYAKEHIADYGEQLDRVVAAIVNDGLTSGASISESIGLNRLLVDHVLWVLEHRGWIGRSQTISGNGSLVVKSMPALRRHLTR